MAKQIIKESEITTEQRIDELEKEINSFYETPIVLRADTIRLEYIDTGVFSVDRETGGIARGRWITLIGEESSFKSTLMYIMAGKYQRICGNCMKGHISEVSYTKCKVPIKPDGDVAVLKKGELICTKYIADKLKRNLYCPNEKIEQSRDLTLFSYELECSECNNPQYSMFCLIDAEHNYTKVWARKWGVIHKNTLLTRTRTSQMIGEIVRKVMNTGHCTFVGVDSVEAHGPDEEHERAVNEPTMGLQATVWNRITRIATGLLNKSFKYNYTKNDGTKISVWRTPEPILCKIHQWREKLNMMNPRMDNRTVPAGRGGKYADSIRIDLSRGERVYVEKKVRGKTVRDQVGEWYNFYLGKQKTGMPYRKGRFYYDFINQKIINEYSIIDYGVEFGVINQAGAWFSVNEQKAQGRDKLAQLLLDDNKLKQFVIKQLKRVDSDY